jgi:glucosylceramidase
MSGGRWQRRRIEVVVLTTVTVLLAALLIGLVGPLRSVVVEAGRSRLSDAPPPSPTVWQTRPSGETIAVDATMIDGAAVRTIVISSGAAAGRWRGVGGALTDASAGLLAAHPAGVEMLFAEPDAGGAGLDLVRLPLSSTDFSTGPWAWAWDPVSRTAVPTPRAEAALAVLATIGSRRPGVSVIGASWTAPAPMRSDTTAAGGDLLDAAVDDYAGLLAAQAAWLVERGIRLDAMSLGNEPGHVAADAPTLGMTERQMTELSHIVGPQLDELGVDLLALDHNWSDAHLAESLLLNGDFDAVGFHCYDGDASLAIVPSDHLVTECTATTGDWRSSVGWMARELVEAPIEAGSTGLVMWNLALDPYHGPKAAGGCDDCRGLVTIDPVSGAIERSPELAVLTHLSLAADIGAAVIPTAWCPRFRRSRSRIPMGASGCSSTTTRIGRSRST